MSGKTDLEDLITKGIDLKNRRIYFGNPTEEEGSDFNWSTVEVTIRAIDRMLFDYPKKPITISMSSGGGDTYQMFRLVDAINDSTAKIIFEGSGEICSSAAYLMAACDERVLYPNAVVMIHDMSESGDESITNTDRKISNDESDRVQKALYDLLAVNSRMGADFWSEVLHRDLYLSPEECIMLGIADRVTEPKKRGNLRKVRTHAMKQIPEKKELNKLIRGIYKRVHKGKHHTKLELHIPTEEFDQTLEVDETPVSEEYLNTLNNSNGVSLPILIEPEKPAQVIPETPKLDNPK